jgi:hypothetical protein
LDAVLTTLLCKNLIVAKSKEVKTGCNLTKSSVEGYGSKGAVLSMMMMMMMMMIMMIGYMSFDDSRALCSL